MTCITFSRICIISFCIQTTEKMYLNARKALSISGDSRSQDSFQSLIQRFKISISNCHLSITLPRSIQNKEIQKCYTV